MPPSAMQKHRGIILIVTLVVLTLLLLVYYLPYGGRHYLTTREELNRVSAEIAALKVQNQELRDEITLLKSDTNYIEKIARQKLGMLKKNEIVFEVPEKKGRR